MKLMTTAIDYCSKCRKDTVHDVNIVATNAGDSCYQLACRECQSKQASKASGDQTPKPRNHEEADLQQAVIEYAHLKGWHVASIRPARTFKGWRTAWAADGEGMKDLILVRERVVWMELKATRGMVSMKQQAWHEWLVTAKQEAHIFYPKDWGTILKVLD